MAAGGVKRCSIVYRVVYRGIRIILKDERRQYARSCFYIKFKLLCWTSMTVELGRTALIPMAGDSGLDLALL